MRFLGGRMNRALFGLGGLIVLAVVASTLFAQAAPAANPPFDHEAMVQAGVQCLFCHSDARKSPAAGMPSMELCAGCHRVIATDSPRIQEVMAYWDQQMPIPWPRLIRMPRFVYFTHRVHLAAGYNCERCHGDVGHMTIARPVADMNMGWCLECHNDQPPEARVRLRDCLVCHK